MSDYYVDLSGKTAGPFTVEELQALLLSGSVSPATLYTTPKSVDWLPLATIWPLLRIEAPRPLPPARRGDVICNSCGNVGSSVRQMRGSILIEIVLWLCFLLPGFIYTLWRYTSTYKMCRACGHADLIPADSPKGRELVRVSG